MKFQLRDLFWTVTCFAILFAWGAQYHYLMGTIKDRDSIIASRDESINYLINKGKISEHAAKYWERETNEQFRRTLDAHADTDFEKGFKEGFEETMRKAGLSDDY